MAGKRASTKPKWARQRGFVTNELPIVFGIFCLFCLVLAAATGVAFNLAWYWRVLAGFGFFGVGLGWFFGYCLIMDRRQKREAEARSKGKTQPTDKVGTVDPPDVDAVP
jgi:hypothetical protein